MKISAVLGLLCMCLLVVAPIESSKHGSDFVHQELQSRAAFAEFLAKNPKIFKIPLGKPKGKVHHVGKVPTRQKQQKSHANGDDSDSVAHYGARPAPKVAPKPAGRPVPKPAPRPAPRPAPKSNKARPKPDSWKAQVIRPSSPGRTQVRRGRDTTNDGDKPADSARRYSNNASRKSSDDSSKAADSRQSGSSIARKSAPDSRKPADDASTASTYAAKPADFDSKPAD